MVLLDLGLPDGDGWELARALKAEHPAVRIVVVTGWAREADRLRSAQAGCDAHLVKPVNPRVLEAVLG